jgi:hypothetical protein
MLGHHEEDEIVAGRVSSNDIEDNKEPAREEVSGRIYSRTKEEAI